jgi:DNA-binding response OmpR family regulator
MHILLAEDTLDTRRLWEWFLSNAGHTVELAVNGAVAVQMATARSYDVILLDVELFAFY